MLKKLLTAAAPLLLATAFAVEPSTPLTEEQEKAILDTFLYEAHRGDLPITEQIANWARANHLTDQQITDFVLKMVDELFRKGIYDSVPYMQRRHYGARTILLLKQFNPGKEDTQRLLQELIKQNYWNLTQSYASFIYTELYADTLPDDKYVNEQMTTGNLFDSDTKSLMYSVLRERYDNATPEGKQKIVDRIYSWSQHNGGATSSFLDNDQFLLKYKENYSTDLNRKKLLEQAMEHIRKTDPEKTTEYYHHMKKELDNFGQQNSGTEAR